MELPAEVGHLTFNRVSWRTDSYATVVSHHSFPNNFWTSY